MITSLTIRFPLQSINLDWISLPTNPECVTCKSGTFTLKSNHRPPYRLQLLTLPPSSTIQIITFTSNNMLSLSWWAYFLILSVGAGALALALLILFRKHGLVLFTPEVDAEFHCMAESAHIIRHQWLAHQQAQEIAWNHRTTLLHQPFIELDTIITTPTLAHASDYCAHCSKRQGRIFTPIDFNVHNSLHSNILLTTNYMIPPALTYPASYSLHPDSPTLGTNPEIFIYSPTPPTSPTESLPTHSYPPGLRSEPSHSTIASESDCDVTSRTAQIVILIRLTGDSQIFKWGGQWWDPLGFGYRAVGWKRSRSQPKNNHKSRKGSIAFWQESHGIARVARSWRSCRLVSGFSSLGFVNFTCIRFLAMLVTKLNRLFCGPLLYLPLSFYSGYLLFKTTLLYIVENKKRGLSKLPVQR